MNSPSMKDLVYPWNEVNAEGAKTQRFFLHHPPGIELDDETLRDGLQSTSVTHPAIEDKLRILHYMNDLGVHIADIGLPAAGASVQADCTRIAQEVASQKLHIHLACAGRTLPNDVVPIIEIMQKTGVEVEAHLFIGSSSIRRFAEGWDLEKLLKATETVMDFCQKNNVPVMYVTEDTTRAEPEVIKKLYTTAIEGGARRICISDTVGYSTPDGVINLVSYVKAVVAATGEDIKIDWHGHNDRGLGLCNALVAAIDAGVDRIHGTCLGIGERTGNAAIDQIIVNLFLMGLYKKDLGVLGEYCQFVSKVCGVDIPPHYPAVGKDAFRTSTGVHAAAVIKSFDCVEDRWLADYVYSAVPAHALGLEQVIEIGPVSGKSNVLYWFKKRGLSAADEVVERILQFAKSSNRVLTDEEIRKLL
ncbi:LeuA family protein [Myxococcota bacterium]|nr:LeuA family protein [Myxococcota bacterium]